VRVYAGMQAAASRQGYPESIASGRRGRQARRTRDDVVAVIKNSQRE